MFFQFDPKYSKKIEKNRTDNVFIFFKNKNKNCLADMEKQIIEIELKRICSENFEFSRIPQREIDPYKYQMKILQKEIFQNIYYFKQKREWYDMWYFYLQKNKNIYVFDLWKLILEYIDFLNRHDIIFFSLGKEFSTQNKKEKEYKIDIELRIWELFKFVQEMDLDFQEWFSTIKFS